MSRTTRSKLLSTALSGLVMLAAGGCASLGGTGSEGAGAASAEAVETAASMMKIADASRARGDLATAAALYRRAHALSPQNIQPLLRLGFTLNDAGEGTEAAEAFRRALRLDPKHAEAMRGFGFAMMQRSQPDLAIEQFEAALELGEDVRLYNALGVAYDMKGDRRGAQAYYQVGLGLEPDNLSLRSNYGLSLALDGQHEEAIELLASLSHDPRATAHHRQILALAYGLSGDLDAAAQTARIDLDEASVQQTVRYIQSLQAK